MDNLIIFLVCISVAGGIVECAFFKKTGLFLSLSKSFLIPGIIFFTSLFLSYASSSYGSFYPFPIKILLFSTFIAVLFGLIILVPVEVKKLKEKKVMEEKRRRRETQAQGAILKEAVKTALKEHEADKSDTTETGNTETPENKS